MKGGGLLLSCTVDENYALLHKPRPDGLAQAWEISGPGQKPFQVPQILLFLWQVRVIRSEMVERSVKYHCGKSDELDSAPRALNGSESVLRAPDF